MREARIILPVNDNQGASLNYTNQRLQIDLIDQFGGYTHTTANGGWKSPDGKLYHEPVNVYDVAVCVEGFELLTGIASKYSALAGQECVYVRDTSGDVHFIDGSAFDKAAA